MGSRSPKRQSFEEDPGNIGEPSFIDDFLTYLDSPLGQRSVEVREAAWGLLETADVDAKNRQIIWEDGKRLSISASARRIQETYPDDAIDLIEAHVICWLQMEFSPSTYTPKQLDELDELTDAWVEDHERQAAAATKRPRTRHS